MELKPHHVKLGIPRPVGTSPAALLWLTPIPTLQIEEGRYTFSVMPRAPNENLSFNRQSRRLHMGILAWIIVGLIAGWLAGKVMKGGGYGALVDIILGILGGVLGGWLFGLVGLWPGRGLIGSIIVAFIGAVILVAITRAIKRA